MSSEAGKTPLDQKEWKLQMQYDVKAWCRDRMMGDTGCLASRYSGVRMRGIILGFDRSANTGIISGEEGRHYRFTAGEVDSPAEIRVGLRVEFSAMGEEARHIQALPDDAGNAMGELGREFSAHMDASSGMTDRSSALSLWQYFLKVQDWRNIDWTKTAGRGRARRKEYWGFWVFATLFGLPLYLFGQSQFQDDVERWYFFLPTILVGLYFLPGNVNVAIRRLHDIGLSGWYYLVVFVPFAGPIFNVVTSVMPSQPITNKWGPPPYTK